MAQPVPHEMGPAVSSAPHASLHCWLTKNHHELWPVQHNYTGSTHVQPGILPEHVNYLYK